jgi:RNA polymerase II subunit A C-terminal domain phosphatase SSU72
MSFNVCTVCSSNMNRSMEAQRVLTEAGYKVSSYGTGNCVKIPGLTKETPNVFQFGTPYKEILSTLQQQESVVPEENRNFAKQGLYDMLERNIGLKECPENWHVQSTDKILENDIVICCDEKCYEILLDDCARRGIKRGTPLLIFNVDVIDLHTKSLEAGQAILKLMNLLEELKINSKKESDFYDNIGSVAGQWQLEYQNLPILYKIQIL